MKINKKSLMPATALVVAVLLAFGSTAFKADRPLATTTMYYQGTSFTQADVQTKSNWNTTSVSCPTGTVKACQVTVPSTDVSGGAFISTISLVASSSTPSVLTDVKNSGTSVDPTIKNRSN